jgi:hypothetical protein
MDERKVNEKQRALPGKIEQRLAELAQMNEFDQGDVAHCRRTYWIEREAWHQILIDCYERALKRQQQP